MSVIELDVPLLVTGLALLGWFRFKKPFHEFQVACQVFATFWAQYSFVVSWSLGKLIPFFSSSSVIKGRVWHGELFLPFAFYVSSLGVVLSFFWTVPAGVAFAYGEGRVWVQLTNFFLLGMTARNLALAMTSERGAVLMWKGLVILGVVHGAAFLYQYLATAFGFPYIGISRAHGLNFEAGAGDVAAFALDGGVEILRPGGLAGEPKTVAIVFGIVILGILASANVIGVSKRWLMLSKISLLLSSVGILGAFSTSGYIGFVVAYTFLVVLGAIRVRMAIKAVLLFVVFFVFGEVLLRLLGLPGFLDLLLARTVDRVGGGGGMDPPVEAAIAILSNDYSVLLLGTGIGGGSFRIMQQLGMVFEFALAPNVGFVALLLEFGVLGFVLLLLPFLALTLRVAKFLRRPGEWSSRFLLSLSVASMTFMMTGSGIALGYSLAVGCLLGAASRIKRPR